MMEYSYAYKNTISGLFSVRSSRRVTDYLPNCRFNNNTNCFGYWKIDFSKDRIEVPTALFALASAIPTNGSLASDELIVVVGLVNNYLRKVAGAESIFKIANRETNLDSFVKVTTPKNIVYYVAPGMVLNSNREPMFLTTRVTNRDFIAADMEVNMYINSKLFLNQDDVVYKNLIKKTIPYIMSTSSQHIAALQWLSIKGEKINVIFTEDFSNFFETPKHPTQEEIVNTKDFLLEHSAEVLTQFNADVF